MSGSRRPESGISTLVFQGLFIGLVAAGSIYLNTLFHAPPRYDGAGYATLAWGLSQGLGYHEWQHPNAPPHSHFPPGYPLVLSFLFQIFGRNVVAAHVFSLLLTTAATVLTWLWFRSLYTAKVALLLGLALAINWTWGRVGGAILSEPLFVFLTAVVLLLNGWGRGRGMGFDISLGLVLGACLLTRHVGICLAAAVMLDRLFRRQVASATATLLAMSAIVLPWVGWIASSGRDTQAGLFIGTNVLDLLSRQALFYIRRIPDQLVGPVVELATVFGRSGIVAALATLGATIAFLILIRGCGRLLRSRRRRLAALVPLTTLALLLVWPFTEAGRFLIPLLPFLLVGFMEGAAPLCGKRRFISPRIWAAALIVLASLPYALYAIVTSRALAQERTHAAFDEACSWIAKEATRSGPVATHYAADLSWQTGRPALDLGSSNDAAFSTTLDLFGVAYLVVDDQPFANATPDPMALAIKRSPEDVRLVWGPQRGVSIFEVIRRRKHETTKPNVLHF